jgi:hypothetical protein
MTVEQDQVAFDQACRSRPAQFRGMLGEKAIQPWIGCGRDQALGRRSTDPAIKRTTPIVIAESATLKTGKKWKLMKSVTVPWTMRSYHSAAHDQAEHGVIPWSAGIPRDVDGQSDRHQDGRNQKQACAGGGEPESSAGVSHVGYADQVADHRDLGPEWDLCDHKALRDAIEHENGDCDDHEPDAGRGHARFKPIQSCSPSSIICSPS